MRPLFTAFRRIVAVLLASTVVGLAPALRAHDPGVSTAQIQLLPQGLHVETGLAPADAQWMLAPALRTEEPWDQARFEAVQAALAALAPQLCEIRVGAQLLAPRQARVQLLPGDNVSFQLEYPPVAAGVHVTMRAAHLSRLPATHREFVIVADARGSTIAKKLLSARDYTLEFALPLAAVGDAPAPAAPPEESAGSTAWGFIKLGVEHIWMGYDHLLFLFALLIVCRTFKSIVAIVTCFTLAHSLTLAVATLQLFNLPARWVEPAIAASIVFVGVENLWRRGEEPPARWALTFAFGLVHGFGFASVLRDLGVGEELGGIVLPLFAFNLGVELGQIAIASLVLPIVWHLRKQEAFVRRGVPALSALVTAAGLYWLVQRTVFA